MTNEKLISLVANKGFGLGKIKGGFEIWNGKGDSFKKHTFKGSRKDFIAYVKGL